MVETVTMKLEYDVFPNFYKKYDWVAYEEEDNLFTGREYYLKNFWRNLSNVANNDYSRQNKTFIGQRKLGKTAFLVRCYNVAFWEQDEVIPFYYCFPQTEKLSLHDIANGIAFKLLQQAIGFITKDREILEEKEEEVLFYLLKEKNYPWLKKLTMYWNINKRERENCSAYLVLQKTWKLVDILSGIFSKKCLLIIDEYQKTVSLLDDNNKPIACHESIGETVNNRNILTMISGSQISMLAHRVLTSELRNRIPGETFDPLLENEAKQLIREYTAQKGYKGIEDDVYKLTGGNPYYIKMLFTPTNKFYKFHHREKSWKNQKEVMEIYNFEMLHRQGEVYCFWETHLNEKYKLLNGDPPEHKGITMRLLKYIAEKNQMVNMDELREKFPEIENMREKIEHLRDADLLMDSMQTEEVYNFSDTVLPVLITRMHQKVTLGDNKPETFAKYQQEWLRVQEQRMTKHYEETEKTVKNVQSSVSKLKKEVRSRNKELQKRINQVTTKIQTAKNNKLGKANLANGIKAQSKAAIAVEKVFAQNKTIFSNDYKLQGSLISTNARLASGRGHEIDFFGVLEGTNGIKPKEYALIGEVKHNKKQAVSEAAVDKFIDSIGVVKRDARKQKAICIFVSKTGFAKKAIPILKRDQVIYGNLKEVIEQISL